MKHMHVTLHHQDDTLALHYSYSHLSVNRTFLNCSIYALWWTLRNYQIRELCQKTGMNHNSFFCFQFASGQHAAIARFVIEHVTPCLSEGTWSVCSNPSHLFSMWCTIRNYLLRQNSSRKCICRELYFMSSVRNRQTIVSTYLLIHPAAIPVIHYHSKPACIISVSTVSTQLREATPTPS